jgi:hypothetical protein
MKKVILLSLIAAISAAATGYAQAAATEQEFYGVWKSTQAVDTTLSIGQTDKGLYVTQRQQNFFGSFSQHSMPAHIENGNLAVGTTAIQLSHIGAVPALVTYIGNDQFVIFTKYSDLPPN